MGLIKVWNRNMGIFRTGTRRIWKSFLFTCPKLPIETFDEIIIWLFQFRIFRVETFKFSIETFDEIIVRLFQFRTFRTEAFRIWKSFLISVFKLWIETFSNPNV